MIQFSPGISGGGGGISQWSGGVVTAVGTMVYYGNSVFIANQAFTTGASFEADAINGYWSYINTSINNNNLMLSGFDFEDGDTGGWTAIGCATVTNGFPSSVGSGAAAFSAANGGRAKGANTTAPAVVSSGQLNGKYSLNYATSGAGTIGDMYISQAIPIPISMQAKVLQIKFKYKSVTGAPVMSGDATNTYAVAVYDMVNNIWIQPSGCFNIVQGSGVGTYTGTIQTASNSTNLQISIYNPVAPVGASSFYVDDFYLGEQITASGAAMSDWVAIPTMAIQGSTASPTKGTHTEQLYTKREGDSLLVRYEYNQTVAGASGTGTYTFNLPAGYTIDLTKVTGGSSVAYASDVGSGSGYDGTTTYGLAVGIYSSTQLTLINNNTASNVGSTLIPFGNAAARIGFYAKIPIVGWSSNTVMSADTDTRVVAFSGVSNGSGLGPTAGYSSAIAFTATFDTHGVWNGSAYPAPSSGFYDVIGSLNLVSTNVLANRYFASVQVNGVEQIRGADVTPTVSTFTGCPFSGKVKCNSGDLITVKLFAAGNNSVSTLTLDAATLNISKLSGPATIAASESVNALYTGAPPTGTLAAAYNTTTFGTKVRDSHNQYASGSYTIPISGTYSIQASVAITATYSLGKLGVVAVFVDGAQAYTNIQVAAAAVSTLYPEVVVFSVPLNAGQVVTIRCYCDATTPTFSSVANQNFFSLTRSGN
jgi:hypothetical protein